VPLQVMVAIGYLNLLQTGAWRHHSPLPSRHRELVSKQNKTYVVIQEKKVYIYCAVVHLPDLINRSVLHTNPPNSTYKALEKKANARHFEAHCRMPLDPANTSTIPAKS
jgi:hypothetical protein